MNAIAACIAAGLVLAPPQPCAGLLTDAVIVDVALLTGLAVAAMIVLAQAQTSSPNYQQAIAKLRFHMNLHFVLGVPVVLRALQGEVAKDPTRLDNARQVATDLGLDPDRVAPSNTLPATQQDVLARAKADVQAKTAACTCQARLSYRGDRPGRAIAVMFASGFPPDGTNADLQSHAEGRVGDSYYVSTSKLWEIAAGFAQRNGNVFFVCSERGIEVNFALGSRSPFPEQEELAMPGGIPPREIVGAVALRAAVPTTYEPNANFACH